MFSAASQPPATLPSDLKRSNRRQILEKFRGKSACTVNEIAEEIGVSRQTVMKSIQFFMDKGWIVSLGKSHSSAIGGKPPELYALSGERMLLGISLWPSLQQIALMNLRGEILELRRMPDALNTHFETAMCGIESRITDLLLQRQIAPEQICGVCISTSGIVNHRSNRLKFSSMRPSWGSDVPIAQRLSACFAPDTPIRVENVGKVVGRSLLHRPELQQKRILSVFSAWGGVCASFIENDRIRNGKDSLIGEIGHMQIAPEDPELCGCGSHGCFERMVSDARLRKVIAATLSDHPESMLNALPMHEITVRDLFAASERGDAYARELSAPLARYFATALRNVSLMFDPELVIMQGDYAHADEAFCAQFQRSLMDFHYYPEGGPFELRLDRRPIHELDVQGAYILLIDQFFNDPTLYA